MKCKCCNRNRSKNDIRFGFCFDCADGESIIQDGLDMYDKEIPKEKGMSLSMSKLQHILKKYIKL